MNRLLKNAHLLRCARSPRSNVLHEYAFACRISAPRTWDFFDQPVIEVCPEFDSRPKKEIRGCISTVIFIMAAAVY
jgi:hypothetical protein